MKIGNPSDKSSGVGPVSPSRSEPASGATKAKEAGSSTADESSKVELSKAASALISGGANSDFDDANQAHDPGFEILYPGLQRGELLGRQHESAQSGRGDKEAEHNLKDKDCRFHNLVSFSCND